MPGELLQSIPPELMSSVFEGAKSSGSSLKALLPAALGGVALLTGGIRSYTAVPEEHRGLRHHGGSMRDGNGELYGLVQPGFKWHSPRNGIKHISIQDRVSDLVFHTQGTEEARRKQLVVARLTWGVIRDYDPATGKRIPSYNGIPYPELIWRAINSTEDGTELSQRVIGKTSEPLRHILAAADRPEALVGSEVLAQIQQKCGSFLMDRCSVELRDLDLLDVADSEAQTLVNGRGGEKAWTIPIGSPSLPPLGGSSLSPTQLEEARVVLPQIFSADD